MNKKNEKERELPDHLQNLENFFIEIPEDGADFSLYEPYQTQESESLLVFESEKRGGLTKNGNKEENGNNKDNDNFNFNLNLPPININKNDPLLNTIHLQDLSKIKSWGRSDLKGCKQSFTRREGKKLIILKTRKRKKTKKLDRVLEKAKVSKQKKSQRLDSYQQEIKSKFKKKQIVKNLNGEMVDILSPMTKEQFNLLSKEQKAQRKKLQNRISAETSRGRARIRLSNLNELAKSLKKKNQSLSVFVNELKQEKDHMRQEIIELKKQVQNPNAKTEQLFSSNFNLEKSKDVENSIHHHHHHENDFYSQKTNNEKMPKENPIIGIFHKMGEKKNEFLQNTKLNKNIFLHSDNYQESLASGFLLIFLICCGILFHNTLIVHSQGKRTTTTTLAFSSRHLAASDKNLILFDDQDYEDHDDFYEDMTNYWDTSFLQCLSDIPICLKTIFCPCLVLAGNKAGADERECNLCDCLCCPREYFTRQQIRSKYGFEESVLMDCLMTTPPLLMLALCQDARELKARKDMK
ncbi:cell number regulator [Anaeramoeba flamelloides]|uniref:Cell number regulator n=1 Tax=Anaeramoeba flamelloides TaxID=1746091 RepID=A0AAV7ZIG0_9EUKA|nr:cell number regulator [Anaeramoeba flamelloides]